MPRPRQCDALLAGFKGRTDRSEEGSFFQVIEKQLIGADKQIAGRQAEVVQGAHVECSAGPRQRQARTANGRPRDRELAQRSAVCAFAAEILLS